MVRSTIGMPEARFTFARSTALLVSEVITQTWAMACIQVPVMEMASPVI